MARLVGRSLTRRSFLNKASLAASTALLVPELSVRALQREDGRPIRVEGRVESGGRGVPGVRVSDGRNVTISGPDGHYSLVSSADSRFIWMCVPDGYRIPTGPAGTARFYHRIEPGTDEATAVFSLEQMPTSGSHAFLLLADPQTQTDFEVDRLLTETVPDITATLGGLSNQEVFGVACGDIMYDNLELFPRYEEAVRATGVPFFQVVGNHDLDPASTDEGSVKTFSDYFGPRYYSFDRGEIHYVVLDDVFWFGGGYMGYLDADQLVWLEQDLQNVEQGRTVVVFLHIPLLSTQFRRRGDSSPSRGISVSNREVLYRLLEPFQSHVLSGHTHEHEHVFEGGVHEHVHAAVCGAWWSGDICFDGAPNGYGIYEAAGSDLKWRYKATGLPPEHQIRAYPPGVDPKAPDEIVANVWGWDPEWSVCWYEGGERRGMMSRRVGTDPLSEQLHRGADRPSHRPWVEPVLTDHLFYCPAPQPGVQTTVEATDRWGRVFVTDVPGA